MRVDIFGDDEGLKAIAINPSSISELYFIRGVIQAGQVCMWHVGTEEQHADVFTKCLWRKVILHQGRIYLYYWGYIK